MLKHLGGEELEHLAALVHSLLGERLVVLDVFIIKLFVVDSIENIGPHYAKALRLWREAFLNNWEERIKPQLVKEQQKMDDEGAAIFKRKWDYYFRYSEAGFSTKTLGDVIITVGREGALHVYRERGGRRLTTGCRPPRRGGGRATPARRSTAA